MEFTLGRFTFTESDIANPGEFVPAGEYNPHGFRPHVIEGVYGVVCVVFASNVQDALDEAVDLDRLDAYLVSEEDFAEATEEGREDEFACAYLGNGDEPFDLTDLDVESFPVKSMPKELTDYLIEWQKREGYRDDD